MEKQLSIEDRHERIREEIAKNPHRADRAIGRLLGENHHLVGRVRGKMLQAKRDNVPADVPAPLGHVPDVPADDGDDDDGLPMDLEYHSFSFHKLPDEAIAIWPRKMTAAFIHPDNGCLVIAQDTTSVMQEDTVIHIPAEQIDDFVAHLIEIARRRT